MVGQGQGRRDDSHGDRTRLRAFFPPAVGPPGRSGDERAKGTTMSQRINQIKQSGVDAAKTPFASFVYGRGWKGHKTAETATKAMLRDSRWFAKTHGGQPQAMVVDAATGKPV